MSIKKQILSLVIIPLIILAAVIGTVGVVIAEGYINDEIHETLRTSVLGFSGDIDIYASEGIDITVFTGDTRTESSIDGVIGTKASDIVIQKVLVEGQDYFDTNVSVNGQPYYGYYLPTSTGMLFAGKPRTAVTKNLNSYVTIIVVICCISLILITIVAYIIGQQMAKSIQGTASNMRLLAGGSLSKVQKTTAKSGASAQKNEINAMINATNSLVERLSGIIGNVKETGFRVDKASNELSNAVEVVMNSTGQVSKAVEVIAHGAVDQNASTKDIIASLDEVNRNIMTIEDAVTDIGTYVTEMNDCRESVHTSIDMLSSSSGITTTNVEKIRLQIGKTHEQVDKIEQIVNVIEEIASETKMLSLNASIEAARAGEAGRGFAVVADTINSLSENVTTQVKEISNIVAELVVDFSQCEVDINSVVESNQHQMDEIDAVIEQFSDLQNSINNTVERINTIGQSIAEVADECQGVLEGAHSLSQISESNASATQQVNSNIEELNAVVMQIDANAKGLADKSDDLSHQLQFFQ